MTVMPPPDSWHRDIPVYENLYDGWNFIKTASPLNEYKFARTAKNILQPGCRTVLVRTLCLVDFKSEPTCVKQNSAEQREPAYFDPGGQGVLFAEIGV